MPEEFRKSTDTESLTLFSERVRFDYFFQSHNEVGIQLEAGNCLIKKIYKTSIREATPFSTFWKNFLLGETVFSNDIGTKPIKVADLFCATGGLSLGMRAAASFLGIPLQFALGIDLDGRALDVYRHHHPEAQTFVGNVEHFIDYQVRGKGSHAEFAYMPELTELGKKYDSEYDLVIAGPPCQGHSTMNVKTRYDDPRNKLYVSAVAFAIAVNAKTLIIENVPGVTRDVNGVVYSALNLLRRAGYYISAETLSADKLGWPQTRKRFFLVASKQPFSVNLDEIKFAARRDPLNVRWAIGEFEKLEGESLMFSAPELSPENRMRVQYLQESNQHDLPLHLRPKSHQEGTTFTTVYGKLSWDKPSGTITTGFSSPGRGRYTHPSQPRTLAPIEASRLQGFPDDYFPIKKLVPDIRRMELAKWIGDAVPTILGFYSGIVGLFQTRNVSNDTEK